MHTDSSTFDGFFYTEDREHPGSIIGLPMNHKQHAVFAALLDDFPLCEVDHATYWRSCYRFVMYDAPQGYLAWQGRSFWLVALPQLNERGRFGDTSGLHLVEFTANRIRYAWVDPARFQEPTLVGPAEPGLQIKDSGIMRAIDAMRLFSPQADDEDDDYFPEDDGSMDEDDSIEITLPDALSELVITPWYWHRCETNTPDGQRPLTTDELAVLNDNVRWTDDLHQEMAAKFGL